MAQNLTPSSGDPGTDDEDVTLSGDELDNILAGNELTEVDLSGGMPEDALAVGEEAFGDGEAATELAAENAHAASEDLPDSLLTDGAEETGFDLGGEIEAGIPEIPDLESASIQLDPEEALPDLDSTVLEISELEEPAEVSGEETPAPVDDLEGMGDVELPDLGEAEASSEATPAVEMEDEDSFDDVELPDLAMEGGVEGEADVVPALNAADADADHEEVEIIDDGDEPSEILPGDEAPAPDAVAADVPAAEEDETVSLSNAELDNILGDVDESQVIDLDNRGQEDADPAGEGSADANGVAAAADDDSEIVSLSSEELDRIAEIPETDSDLTEESRNFEREILSDAQVDLEVDASAEEITEDPGPEPVTATESMIDETPAEAAPIQATPDEDPLAATLQEIEEIDDSSLAPAVAEPGTAAFDGTITQADIDHAVRLAPEKSGEVGAPREPTRRAAASKWDEKELYELFLFLDELLESLPDEQIKRFAKSSQYDRYIAMLNRLGI